LVKGVSLNHSYNAWNTEALHSSLGLVPLLLDPEAPEKQGPLAFASILRFSPLEIYPFGSPQKSPLSNIFKPTTSKKPAKQKNLPPPSVMDSQPKTQRCGRGKTKCEHTISTPNYSTGIG
jgi:hypothetical protein